MACPSTWKGPSGPRDPFAQLEFLIFHALCGTVRCPSPDLDLPVRRLWRLCCFAMRAGHRACGPRRVREWCALDMREWCFRPYEPSSRRAVFPSLHGPPAALLGRWHSPGACVFFPEGGAAHMMYSPFETRRPDPCRVRVRAAQSGVSVYFPLRLSLPPGCARKRPDAAVFMDPCECGSPMDLVGLAKASLIAQLLLSTVDAPGPVLLALFASAACWRRGLSEDATWLILPVVICLSQRLSHACLKARSWTLGWVVGPPRAVCTGRLRPFYGDALLALTGGSCLGAVTLKKLECSKQAYALDTLAWDNITGFRSYCVGRDRVMINEGTVGGIKYFIVRGEILGFMKGEQLRKHLPRMFSLIKAKVGGSKAIRYRPSLNHKRCRPGIGGCCF
ncbi:hypothetical protein H6P81_021422 [Aristolochia fimbriata]|uniref:Uncharacterized protein n=1 Tax=Aristolochia fimbriata TaxID=158543 RepID=A0AAV7DSL3_ARIFI|nr:hypothetical protein H6P81_021422 [Aristolochia fimbriata]